MVKARKNAANRAKLTMNHSLGTKSISRTQDELEERDRRKYSRAEMFGVSHRKPDGSFVNEEAKKKNDKASQVDLLKEQVAFLMQNSRENQVIELEKSRDGRHSY
ncbi:hypothetical protein P8452_25621 [Trifolium repens]|nr:hypothetical protein P8452_25621 [Trifolium repens]